MLNEKQQVLHERYRLISLLARVPQHESWLAVDAEGGQVLIKAWPYEGEQPNEVIRALWDRELRNLFRLSSSPDADSRLVILRDAGIDRLEHCFVMVLSAPGFEPLAAQGTTGCEICAKWRSAFHYGERCAKSRRA